MIVPKRAVEGEVKAYFIYGYHAMTFLCTFSWERVGFEGKMIIRLYAWVRLGIGRNIIPVRHTFKLKRQCPVRQQVSLRETHEIIAFASMASLSIQQTLDRRNLFDEGENHDSAISSRYTSLTMLQNTIEWLLRFNWTLGSRRFFAHESRSRGVCIHR